MYLPINEKKAAQVTAPKDISEGYGFMTRKDGI